MTDDEDERLARLGHDLANRLAVMAGHVELVRDELSDRTEATRSLDVLDRTIDEMRHLSRKWVGGAALPPARRGAVDVVGVLEELVEEHSALDTQERIRLLGADGTSALVRGARIDLKLALANVLGNALKYSDDDRAVTISVAVQDGLVLVTILDHGVGIEPRDLPHVLTPRFRSERARGSNVDGSGLGLAMSADIVLAHGGRLEVRSTVDRGTSVRVELPETAPDS